MLLQVTKLWHHSWDSGCYCHKECKSCGVRQVSTQITQDLRQEVLENIIHKAMRMKPNVVESWESQRYGNVEHWPRKAVDCDEASLKDRGHVGCTYGSYASGYLYHYRNILNLWNMQDHFNRQIWSKDSLRIFFRRALKCKIWLVLCYNMSRSWFVSRIQPKCL